MPDQGRTEGEGYEIGSWHDGRATLTATGNNPAALLAAGLTGLLAVQRATSGPSGPEDEATTALAIRAEAPDLPGLFTGLAAALIDLVDDDDYDVRAVRFDGMVRTDTGLAGWGYAFAVAAGGDSVAVAVEDVSVHGPDDQGDITLCATLRRIEQRPEKT